MRQSVIDSVRETASTLYRKGMTMPEAVSEALNQHRISDPRDREPCYKLICSQMGKHGNTIRNAKKQREKARREAEWLRKEAARKRLEKARDKARREAELLAAADAMLRQSRRRGRRTDPAQLPLNLV